MRISWIDEFKGFVLLLVCLYHVEQGFPQATLGMEHLSALRMSAFFFISGVLFSTRRFPDFKSYFVHKSRVLLFPYILLSLLFLALDPVVYQFDLYARPPKMVIMNTRPVIENVGSYIGWNLAKIFVAGKSSIGSGPLWFVFTLYSISIAFFGLQKLCRGKTWAIVLGAAASLVIGWTLYQNHIRLPLGIERGFTTLGFFAAGFASKGAIKKAGESPSKAKTFATLGTGIVAFLLYSLVESPNPNFSIMNNDLGKSFWGFVSSSALGIAGLLSLFLVFARIPDFFFKGILRNISRNALVILAVHWWALLVMRLLVRDVFNKPGIAYTVIPIVAAVVIAAIPLFRCKLYRLLGKEKISVSESLSIR